MTQKKMREISYASDNPIIKKINDLEIESCLLRTITNIRKIAISNGAYSTKNMESQSMRFDNLNVPQWEKEIIVRSWDATKKLSHSLLIKLDELNKMILDSDNVKYNEKSPKDILKEKLKNHVDNL